MKTSIGVLATLFGLASNEVQATGIHTMVQNQVDLENEMWLDEDMSKKKKKAVKKGDPTKKITAPNMAGDDKEEEKLDDVPDVTADDFKDPTLKPFFIVIKGKGSRKVFMSKQKLGIDRVAKIKENPSTKNAVFIFDKRTSTIRLVSERTFALSNKMDKGMKAGQPAVFRRIKAGDKVTADQVLVMGKKNVHNKAKKCLAVDGKNKEMASLTWMSCNKDKAEQKFEKELKNKDKSKPDFFKQRMLIRLNMKGKRNIYLSKEKAGDDFVLKIGKKPTEWRSWFIMDKRTNTIRLFVQPHLAISAKAGKGVKAGASLVLRKYNKKDISQEVTIKGKKIQNKKSHRCLTTQNAENKDEIYVNFWPCSGKETQKWNREVVKGEYEELCKDTIKAGKRYRLCPGKKDKYLGEHCVRHVEMKKGKEILSKKCGKKSWEIAKCSRYQQKGQWYRKCGADHLEKVRKGDPIMS